MIKINNWIFKPAFLPTAAAAILSIILLSLGFWQLQRADEKQILYGVYRESAAREPISLKDAIEQDLMSDELLWREVRLTGEYAETRAYLLDNQVENGVPGYYVFSPFWLQDTNWWVLVNRGWVAAGVYRDQLPVISTPAGAITLKARVYPLQQRLILDNLVEEVFEQNIIRVQKIDLEKIGQQLGYNLIEYVIRLEPASPTGYSLNWQAPGAGAERHLGYAFQWFMLAIVLVIIYFSLNLQIQQDHDD